MKTIYMYFVLIVFISGCGSSKIKDNNQIKNLVENQHFNIESDTAQPLVTTGLSQLQNSGLLGPGNSASYISLIGNSNFLKIKGDSISSYLPYYGERRSNVGYGNSDNGIEFEGLIKAYKAIWNDKKQHYSISFQAKSHNEMFDVRIILYPNMKSYITLSSASRTSITYIGKVHNINNGQMN